MDDARHECSDPDLRPGIVRAYKQYLQVSKSKVLDIPTSLPLDSTFWGWGSVSSPLPIDQIQRHVTAHGLLPAAMVQHPSCNDDFRITKEETNGFVPNEVKETFSACRALPFNECRRLGWLEIDSFTNS